MPAIFIKRFLLPDLCRTLGMKYAVCNVPAAPVRKKPSHKVEMVNQLLFGEAMRVTDKKKDWIKIESLHDSYPGWIRNNLVAQCDAPFVSTFLAASLLSEISWNEQKMQIPVGSSLPGFDKEKGQMGTYSYRFSGHCVDPAKAKAGLEHIEEITAPWMNAPYLWGGRTPLGVDCSGFVQVIYRMMGIELLRDAWQQAGQGMKVKALAKAVGGDLAFFKNGKGKITHVGILLNELDILHCSGRVRKDRIDEKGIIHSETGKRTHSLAAIRRYW
jgi:gamma-D-glutamyl-L-lysine dipeptidyl-peptidase